MIENGIALQDGLTARVVLALAQVVDPESDVLAWFNHEPIKELAGMTAAESISAGKQQPLLEFLLSVIAGDRD